MLFKDAHLNFLNYLEAIKNNSQKTIEQYDRHLKKFEEYLEETEKKDLQVENINLDLVESFRSYLYKGKNRISVKTANAYMITMRSFLKFLWKKWIKSLPPTTIDLIKQEDRRVEFLTEDELNRLFNKPNSWFSNYEVYLLNWTQDFWANKFECWRYWSKKKRIYC